MREIKFRAWDTDGKKMIPATNLVLMGSKTIVCGSLPWETWKDTRTIENNLMQYTGLKDKNGKEIYEGDIIMREDKNGSWVVKWNDKCAGFISEWGDDWKWIKSDYQPIYEIIGNIYESPELPKEGQK